MADKINSELACHGYSNKLLAAGQRLETYLSQKAERIRVPWSELLNFWTALVDTARRVSLFIVIISFKLMAWSNVFCVPFYIWPYFIWQSIFATSMSS